MKEKGFTLIELLAVIVILAIIALIATPIILNIINDAKQESQERSIELYASAVKNAIAKYQLNNITAPTSFDQLEIEYDGNVECTTEELYSDGSIYLADCTVNGDAIDYTYGIDQTPPACSIERQDVSKYSVGDVVTCTLSESTDKFYVIEEAELSAGTIQMLTEKNIHTTNYRQSDDAGRVAFSSTNYWSSETTYPVDVYDDRNDIVKPIVDKYVEYLNTKLTNAEGSLLTYSQLENLGCSGNDQSCESSPSWVYGMEGYWTASAYNNDSVWVVGSWGPFFELPFSSGGPDTHVHPVITISTSDMQ